MSFPTGITINTTNLDSGTDSPASARADLYDLAVAVNDIIGSENAANGVLTLDATGKINSTAFPTSITTATLTLNPTSNYVTISDCLRLPAKIVADVAADFPSPQTGDIIALSNGAAGQPCLAMYNGSAWKVISLGATISAT